VGLGGLLASAAVSAVVGIGAEQILGIENPPSVPRDPAKQGDGQPPAGDDEVQAYLRSMPACTCYKNPCRCARDASGKRKGPRYV
jgi:hypothetical protein